MSNDRPVTIVTGAGGGLGRCYALGLAKAGHRVVVNDLGTGRDGVGSTSAMADTVVEEIRAAGGQAAADYSSVATREGAETLVAAALEAFGRVDGLVSNAGFLRDASFHKMTDEQWDAIIEVHLNGTRNVTSAVWPRLREQGHGRLVFATSTAGLFGQFGQANYAAAKLGMVGLMNALVIEGASSGITVNAVAPLAATRMTEGVAPAEVLAELGPEHVAPIVVRLASPDLKESGVILIVGGGRCHRVQLFANDGVQFAEVPTAAEVDGVWEKLLNMDGAHVATNPV